MSDKEAKIIAKRNALAAELRRIRGLKKRGDKKRDDRRKILAGAFLLEQAGRDAEINAWMMRGLDEFLVRPDERELFELASEREPKPVADEQHGLPLAMAS